MSIRSKIAEYRRYRDGVCHCTFDPSGPGVVRIHLIPPKFRLFGSNPYVLLLNGYYMLPIGNTWAAILTEFIRQVNTYDGKPISSDDEQKILDRTVKRIVSLYPGVSRREVVSDLDEILDVVFTVARGGVPASYVERLSIHAYAKHMTAPHRMDLMISAMTDNSGNWKCNQKCKFCYASGQNLSSAKELTTAEWKAIIDKLWQSRVPMVTFTGGEPTLREDLPELVAHAKKFVTRVNTNGVKVTPKSASDLVNAGLDSMQITLYSHDEKIHNSLVGADNFTDTVLGIINAVNAGLDVSINTPLCKKNADYVETLKFVESLGVRFVTASGLILTGNADIHHEEYDLSGEELAKVIKDAKEFCDAHEMEIDFTSPGLISKEILLELGMNIPMCGACLSNMAIAPDGTVVPCQSWLGADASLGNILSCKFTDIWNHQKCVALRNMGEEEALSCPFRTRKEAQNG